MHPRLRKTARDRMAAVTQHDLERRARSMTAGTPRRFVFHELVVLEVPVGAGALVAAAPTADADHLVEFGPARERVVGSVNRNDTTAARDVLLERGPHFG